MDTSTWEPAENLEGLGPGTLQSLLKNLGNRLTRLKRGFPFQKYISYGQDADKNEKKGPPHASRKNWHLVYRLKKKLSQQQKKKQDNNTSIEEKEEESPPWEYAHEIVQKIHLKTAWRVVQMIAALEIKKSVKKLHLFLRLDRAVMMNRSQEEKLLWFFPKGGEMTAMMKPTILKEIKSNKKICDMVIMHKFNKEGPATSSPSNLYICEPQIDFEALQKRRILHYSAQRYHELQSTVVATAAGGTEEVDG